MPIEGAYVVFEGKKPGVYHSWDECKAQLKGRPGARYRIFETFSSAQRHWQIWQRGDRYLSPSPIPADPISSPLRSTSPVSISSSSVSSADESSSDESSYSRDLPSHSHSRWSPKRSSSQTDFGKDGFGTKRQRIGLQEDSIEPARLQPQMEETIEEEARVQLTPEQDRVVDLAMRRNNIFLTGAAGSGKTTVLKEILRRFKKRMERKEHGGNYQVVAPTGIAALPLNGKTTYSFAGWNPDSFRDSINELLKRRSKRVVKAIHDLDVLIIEEISMVENHFLERLNRLFQSVLDNHKAFGGKQVIILGDFHQLPPVKPFALCMHCGGPIPEKTPVPKCISHNCFGKEDANGTSVVEPLKWGDKWAFKSDVWKSLKLRHIKLEQIHRQKDTRFQDILNKIRNGVPLSEEEWRDLEKEKPEPPKNAFAIRLMSRINDVKRFNEKELAALPREYTARTWRAVDTVDKLVLKRDGIDYPPDDGKLKEYRDSLRDHKLPLDLTLKRGARVVLLQNLDHDRGLVNGSQGVVMGFAKAPQEVPLDSEELVGPHKEFRHEAMMTFRKSNEETRPMVHFANGERVLITSVAQAGIRGPLSHTEQYVATRTQLPLALAWALSIHKSQGMTLDYVGASSQHIFESGQLYVALSRATHLGGLTLTGFSRKQLQMDPDVLRFYTETKWEKLERPPKRVSAPAPKMLSLKEKLASKGEGFKIVAKSISKPSPKVSSAP